MVDRVGNCCEMMDLDRRGDRSRWPPGEAYALMRCQVVLIGAEVQTGWLVDVPRGGFSVDGSIILSVCGSRGVREV